MQIDLAGHVSAIRLAATNALLPLFEAVVNSVQAIEERGAEAGLGEITINRSYVLGGDGNSDLQTLPEIVGFEIADNGVGFSDLHCNSFDASFSTLKANFGGKGPVWSRFVVLGPARAWAVSTHKTERYRLGPHTAEPAADNWKACIRFPRTAGSNPAPSVMTTT
jgi:hypothetical protein